MSLGRRHCTKIYILEAQFRAFSFFDIPLKTRYVLGTSDLVEMFSISYVCLDQEGYQCGQQEWITKQGKWFKPTTWHLWVNCKVVWFNNVGALYRFQNYPLWMPSRYPNA